MSKRKRKPIPRTNPIIIRGPMKAPKVKPPEEVQKDLIVAAKEKRDRKANNYLRGGLVPLPEVPEP